MPATASSAPNNHVIASSSYAASDFFARLRTQDDVFRAALPGTLDALAALHDPLAPVPERAIGAELQTRLDTLAGCAATFGYHRLHMEARRLEQRLRVLQAFDHVPAVDWQEWFGQLAGMLAWARIDPRMQVR